MTKELLAAAAGARAKYQLSLDDNKKKKVRHYYYQSITIEFHLFLQCAVIWTLNQTVSQMQAMLAVFFFVNADNRNMLTCSIVRLGDCIITHHE